MDDGRWLFSDGPDLATYEVERAFGDDVVQGRVEIYDDGDETAVVAAALSVPCCCLHEDHGNDYLAEIEWPADEAGVAAAMDLVGAWMAEPVTPDERRAKAGLATSVTGVRRRAALRPDLSDRPTEASASPPGEAGTGVR